MGVDEELGALLGGLIVIAKHIDAVHDISVPTYQVGPDSNMSLTSIRREREDSRSPVEAPTGR
jgi:hypothetical protein